ncbi:MAG: ABC transporter permease [Acidimicrobiales bacterium]|nr:ABC transporter permease [Acidimicrobiales bacterium]MCB9394174.1 ABC transporter permease [Acidimicrobiaceae bacterium]
MNTPVDTRAATRPDSDAVEPPHDDDVLHPEPLGIAVWLSVAWLGLLCLGALLADVLPLADPADTRAGIPLSIPTGQNWLGTDQLGRDLLSRTIHGARVSIVVGVAAVLISAVVGGVIGLAAGYFKRRVDTVSIFGADVLMAFPTVLLAASIVAFTDSRGFTVVVLAIALIYLGPTIRIVRALTLTIANREFVLAARSLGATNARVLRREIAPNVIPTLLSMMIVAIAGAVVAEGGLAYLNLSVAPPTPTWGAMIAAGKPKLDESLYPVLVPGGALFLTVLSLTLIGDAIQKRHGRNLGAI